MVNRTQGRSWVRPELKSIGRIGDIAAAQLTANNQVINDCGVGPGAGTCKS